MSEGEGKRADRIGAYAEQGNVYIDTLIVEQAEERVRLEGIPQNVPLRGATKFVGRDDELEKIHEQLQRRDRVVISAIAGMGGVGKTELAIQYAVRYAQEFPGGICWLSAKETDLVGKIFSFVRLCLHQTIPSELDNAPLTLDQQFELCLQDWKPHGAVLMVLDDVSETTDFQSLVQKLPSRFRVLLTTRVRYLDASFFEVSLDVLAPPKSLELLTELIGSDRIERELEAARELCKSLGQLPLGLELVGRYLAKKPWMLISEMRSQLHLKHEALEQRLTTYVMTAEQGVRAAFELSWEELNDRAMEMGRFLSLFAAVAIPWELVQRITERLEWTPEEMETAREQLYSRHLLQSIDSRSFKLHPLIQEFLAIKLLESKQVEQLRLTFVQVLIEVTREISDTITLSQLSQLAFSIPHIQEIATNKLELVPDENLLAVFNSLTRFYNNQRSYAAVKAWHEHCRIVIRDRLGKDHIKYAICLSNLAGFYISQVELAKAEFLLLEAVEIICQHDASSFSDALAALEIVTDLIDLLRLQGQAEIEALYDRIELLYRQAINICGRLSIHKRYVYYLTGLASLYKGIMLKLNNCCKKP